MEGLVSYGSCCHHLNRLPAEPPGQCSRSPIRDVVAGSGPRTSGIPRESGDPRPHELLAGVRMRRWIFLVIGVVLAIAGVVWILQGLNLLGQSGGMNGQHIWAIIGVICALAGLGFITAGARARRTTARLPGAH
jgi:hypothetical protein